MSTVLILTTPDCSGCKIVEQMLDQWGAEYETIDVTEKPEILQKYSIMSAPGIVINGKLEFTGVPDRKEFKKKLGI